ncbi:unnamed protein product, partial [Oikopleura dioica]
KFRNKPCSRQIELRLFDPAFLPLVAFQNVPGVVPLQFHHCIRDCKVLAANNPRIAALHRERASCRASRKYFVEIVIFFVCF